MILVFREISSILIFALITGLAILSNHFLHHVDVKALNENSVSNNDTFIAEKAYKMLQALNDMGPKVAGTHANEVEAFNYIFNAVNKIRDESTTQNISVDHQIVSGINFDTTNYRNLQNIIVKVQGKTNHAVMLNCHFDTVPGTPGASDDIVMCCVMIEILEILAKSKEKTEHSVIFLFNGCEEQGLEAAHGFITQHPWAREIQGYINLESTGSGGRECLFRSGPKHDWLIRMYRESAPHPFGHGVAEEIYDLGIIPSRTDFQIFRDDGEIPGLDFAYVDGGWRYHTRYDSIEFITLESVQHTGNNILALTKQMANSEEIADPPEGDYAVYFDYLGLFFVSYTRRTGMIINIFISIIAVILPFIIQSRLKIATNFGFVLKETLISLATVLISLIVSAGVCLMLALIMNAVDNSMSWFSTVFIAIGMYGSLAVITQILVYQIIQLLRQKFQFKKFDFFNSSNEEHFESQKVQVQLNGVNLFWAFITFTSSVAGYRFGYITMINLLFSIASNILISFCYVLPDAVKRSQSWVVFHLFGHSFAFLFNCYMMIQLLELFIPITAKTYFANPDILVALICVLWSVLSLSYFIPLTTLVRYRGAVYSMLLTVFLISFVVSFTSIGFPYQNNPSEPRLQRFRIVHIKRNFYDQNQAPMTSSVGFLISKVDRNAQRTLESTFKSDYAMKDWLEHENCIGFDEVFCGFPRFLIFSPRAESGVFIASQKTENLQMKSTKFLITEKSWENSNNFTIRFNASFVALTQVRLTLEKDWKLNESSLHMGDVEESNGKICKSAIIHVGKVSSEDSLEFFKFESLIGRQANGKIATLSLINIESEFVKSKELEEIVSQFPDYTNLYVQQADSSTYEIYV